MSEFLYDEDEEEDFSDLDYCEGDIGYFMNPNKSCTAYMTFGKLPNIKRDSKTLLCTKPGRLTDNFDVSTQLENTNTMFVDVTSKCADQRKKCDDCMVNCAEKMKKHAGSHRCNITADDADNGESPRLQYCYSCCNKQDCSKICEVYHNKECQQLRCITGVVAEFKLRPIFNDHEKSRFACHVELLPNYNLYDLEYSVNVDDKAINDRTIRVSKIFDESYLSIGHEEKVDMNNFLKITINTKISKLPDIIQGDYLTKTFIAGNYKTNGEAFTDGQKIDRTINVRPRTPFGFSFKSWQKENCDSEIMSDMVSSSPDLFIPTSLIDVEYSHRGYYRVNEKSQNNNNLPYIKFLIPENESLLKAVFDPSTVKDDDTLKADLIREENNWNLIIYGELLKCPGAFEIVVKNPLQINPLFHYDVGVKCPINFQLEFQIASYGQDIFNKTFLVDIIDTHRTIKMTIFRPAPNLTEEDLDFFQPNQSFENVVNYDSTREHQIVIFTPAIVVLGVVIICLVFILFIGFLTDKDKLSKADSDKLEIQHMFYVVCYITFRTTYSVIMTFTLLILIVKHLNKESTNTLSQFLQYTETASYRQRLDIEEMHNYVRGEIQRQNNIANQTKQLCEMKIINLQDQLEEAKQSMKVESIDDKEISEIALQYTKIMVMNLTNSVNKFKQEFSTYAKKALERLSKSIVQTSNAIQESKWLKGARIIYDAVKAKRTALGLETKPFMKWAGIEQEVDRLVSDLSLKDFPMPNLTEFLNIDIPKLNIKPAPIPKVSEIVLPRNQWYFQTEKKPNVPENLENKNDESDEKSQEAPSDPMSFETFMAILLVIDAIWFLHRLANTYFTSQLILHGIPIFISCKDLISEETEGEENTEPKKMSKCMSCLHFLKDLNFRIMKTDFVPKLAASVTIYCFIYIALATTDKLLTVKSIASLGYFDALVAPVETSYKLSATRVRMNAYRINKFELPFFEEMVNVRSKRYQLLLEMYAEVQRGVAALRDSEYCMWKKLLDVNHPCNCSEIHVPKLNFDGCELPPITPLPYHRKDIGSHRQFLSKAIIPYIDAARELIMDTAYVIALFVAILILVDALGNVIWIYFKKFNLFPVKPLFEIEFIPVEEEEDKRT